jgi:hypothetical protein
MKTIRLAAIFSATLLAACAAPREAFYADRKEARESVDARAQAKETALANAATGCESDLCRVAVAAIANAGNNVAQVPAQQYRSPAESVLNLVSKALTVGASVYSQQLSGENLVNLAGVIASSAGDRSQHFDYSDHSDNSTAISGSFNDSSDNSSHGDTISDSGNTSDSNNGNAGRDLIGGDRIDNSGNYGDGNRQGSDGPIDDHSGEGDCDGSGDCLPPAEPIDP